MTSGAEDVSPLVALRDVDKRFGTSSRFVALRPTLIGSRARR